MKERLTYGIFFLFSIYFLVDIYGRATKTFELGALMPEFSEAIRCVLACWFGKEVYQGVTKWIDKRAERVIEIADHAQDVTEWLEDRELRNKRKAHHDDDEDLVEVEHD